MSGALSHLRVIDLSRILAGPWAAQTLADLGAEVIKVERPQHGDDTRGWGPPFLKDDNGHDTSETAYFLCANRGKRSVTIDIATPDGQELVRRLVATADVVIENFKVGDLTRYGLDYASLCAIKPDLVYCSITGFGQTGAMRGHAGYDFMIQGMGGLMSLTGEADNVPGGGPKKVGVPVADLMTGMYACVAILASLARRDRHGVGEHIDMALLDCQVAMLSNQAQNYLISGAIPKRYGNAHPNVVPYQSFPTEDGHVILAIGNDGQFQRFCRLAGLDHLSTDARFRTNADRVTHRDELAPLIAAAMQTRTTASWCEELGRNAVPCGPINRLDQTFEDEQVLHRGMRMDLRHPVGATVPLVANPIRFTTHPIEYGDPPPLLGQHTDLVLSDVLGMSNAEIDQLRTQGVL
ncbi:CaiB/BaiF CoA transferase family protein [Bordetella tumulicola]|uniref:CaiB/BaiF CoA transferase family protein n=1 Tax=Bordetella tumulicola TaxID=1649133 RepID=UPI0039F10793